MSKASASDINPKRRASFFDSTGTDSPPPLTRKQLLTRGAAVLLFTFLIRFVCWYYARTEALKVQTTVTSNYKKLARLFLQDGLPGFYSRQSPMSDVDLLGHPPGYPLLLAGIYKVFGESDVAAQFLQITTECAAAVLIMLIAAELLSPRIGIITGILTALSPQLSWNSILVLPDTVSVLPILLGIYLLIHWRKLLSWHHALVVGVLFGCSALLRANNLLLGPFVMVLILARIFPWARLPTGKRLWLAASVLAGTILVIAPVTLRNAIVYRHFIPLSLGAGQTLLEGIADYDDGRRFDIPQTDVGIAEQEAYTDGRPEYAKTLFGPEGIKRERMRLTRGFDVIKSHPFWFAGVMVQRALSMLKFERVPIISADPEHKMAYPSALRLVQRIFLTSVMLPLVLVGLTLIILSKRWEALIALSIVPGYYFVFQSVLHTEYRYVIAMHYFLLAFAAIAIDRGVRLLLSKWPIKSVT